MDERVITLFPLWLRNRLIFGGLEPVLGHIVKSGIALNHRQFSLGSDKTGFNLISIHFNIRAAESGL